MGVLAESVTAFAQPLLDQTDGSPEDMRKAMALAQLCWNLALVSEKQRDKHLGKLRSSLEMDDEEFDDFRLSIVMPMIRRHHEMFPNLRRQGSMNPAAPAPTPPNRSPVSYRIDPSPGPERNAPCPCNSGKKYKRCCGRKTS